jgi:hypothetical protein
MPEQPSLRITLATPCSARWSQMSGDDKKRFCGQCKKHVYDLSAMRFDEVKELLESKVSPCVRFYQRADGTVLTADCPVGLRAKWKRLRDRAWASSAVALVLAALGVFRASTHRRCNDFRTAPDAEAALKWARAMANTPYVGPNEPQKLEPPPSEAWMDERRGRLPGGVSQGRMRMGGLQIAVIRNVHGTDAPK